MTTNNERAGATVPGDEVASQELTALDHWQHGVHLLDLAADCAPGDDLAHYYIGKASAHILAAQTAVMAMHSAPGIPRDDFRAWYAVAGERAARAKMTPAGVDPVAAAAAAGEIIDDLLACLDEQIAGVQEHLKPGLLNARVIVRERGKMWRPR